MKSIQFNDHASLFLIRFKPKHSFSTMAKILSEMSICCIVKYHGKYRLSGTKKKFHTNIKVYSLLKVWNCWIQMKNIFYIIEKEGSRSSGDVKLNPLSFVCNEFMEFHGIK